jgi:anti-sigma B factor antagonist
MHSFPEPRLVVSNAGTSTVVRITDCDGLSDFNVEALGQQLNVLVEGCGPQHLLLDLGGIEFLTSAALGKLVGLHRKLCAEGGKLILVNPTLAVQATLAITRLDKLIEVQRSAA